MSKEWILKELSINSYVFSSKSLIKLTKCSTRLFNVVLRALPKCPYDFAVFETLRSLDRQRMLVKSGRSQTLNSRHLANEDGVSEAVDLVPIVDEKITWKDKEAFLEIKKAMFKVAKELNVEIEWGGNWKSFQDLPHFQI